MRRLLLLATALGVACQIGNAQTTVYARASGPAGYLVTSIATGTPPTATTDNPHGLSVGDVVSIWGMCSGTQYDPASGRSPYNGMFKVGTVPSSFTFTLNSNPGNTAIVGNGNSVSCKSLPSSTGSAQFGGKMTAFTLGTGPYGFLDGLTGVNTRKLALSTANGLITLAVNGGTHVATATTSYSHGIANGDQLAVFGSLNSTLNNGNAQTTAYTAQNVTSTTFDFVVNSGISGGTYTGANLACGPAGTPNDTIGGTEDCLVISQLAFTGNTFWDRVVLETTSLTAATANYTFPIDGGDFWPGEGAVIYPLQYGQIATRFYVERTNTALFNAMIYAMNHIEHIFGVNWLCDSDYGHCTLAQFEGNADEAYIGLSELAAIAIRYLSSAHRQTFIDKIYNNIDQFGVTPSDNSPQMATTDNLNRVVNIGGSNPATGRVVAGDATHVTLQPSDTAGNGAYVGNLIGFTFVAPITNIATGDNVNTFTIITTSTNYYGSEAPYQVTLSGITGCSVLNKFWQYGNGLVYIDQTHFKISIDTTSCSSPTGGTSTSFPVCQRGDSGPCLGLITGYNSGTKEAAVAGGFRSEAGAARTPTVDMVYKIYQTITFNNTTQNTKGVTITGINTKFRTDFAQGDGLLGLNFFGDAILAGDPQLAECFLSPTSNIATTATDTSMTADCNYSFKYSNLDTVVPSKLWVLKAWATGQTGLNHLSQYWEASPGVPAVLFPLNGGAIAAQANGHIAEGANNGLLEVNGHVGLGASIAPYDSRAVLDLAKYQTYGFDYELRHYLNYISGNAHSGSQYSGGVLYGIGQMINCFLSNLPGFPSIDTSGFLNTAMWHLYSILPDLENNGVNGQLATPMGFAIESGDSQLHAGANTQAFLFDPIFYLHPTDDRAAYLRFFLTNTTAINIWTGAEASANYKTPQALILNDPRAGFPLKNFNVQPLQYAMLRGAANGPTNGCKILTGWTCSPAYNSSAFYSRSFDSTGSLSNSWANRSSTLTYFGNRIWTDDHDQPQNGNMYLFKVGPLIGCDAAAGFLQTGTNDNSQHCDIPRIGTIAAGTSLVPGQDSSWPAGNPQVGITPMLSWYSANHGSWDYQYGDQSSKLAAGCSDLRGAYFFGTVDYSTKCVADMKDQTINSGTGAQTIFQFYDIHPPSSTPVEFHIHSLQNNHGQYTGSYGAQYPEGNTTCPGSGGCANLNANRKFQILENNAAADLNPARQYGVETTVVSPGTITLRDDALPISYSSTVNTTISSISSFTPGTTTVIQTATPHNVIQYEHVTISGVAGSGNCNTGSIQNDPLIPTGMVLSVADSTHFTLQFDSSSCSGPTGGTVTTPLRFNATAHGIYTFSTISAISIANPVVITTSTAHGLQLGQFVQIRGTVPTGSCTDLNDNAINLAWYVTNLIDSTHFSVGASTVGCSSVTGGVVYSDYDHAITILGASGSWASPPGGGTLNTYKGNDSQPRQVWAIDADHFSFYSSPDTSAFSPAFDGNVSQVYFHGLGWSHRFSVCGGSTCGAPASSLTAVVVHKVMQTVTDTTLNVTALNPDAGWTGAQTDDKVALFYRGGVLRSTMTSFSTTHSGTAQYMFMGFLPGVYAVTINGSAVSGSPFTITSYADPTITFESTAGTVAVSGTPNGFSITTASLSGASTGSSYSQTLATTGGTGSVTWNVVNGQLCSPLQLNTSTGAITGIPYSAGTCTLVFSATDSSTPQITVYSVPLTINITTGPSLVLSPTSMIFSCISGGLDPSGQNVSISSTGVTLTNWSTSHSQSWLTLSPSSGSAAGTMTVGTTGCGALSLGPHTDTVIVSSSTGGITNSPQTILVTLNVSSGSSGNITTGPSSLTFTCVFGGASPASQNLAIGASGVTLDNFSATKTQPWLSLFPTSGSAAATISVSASCAGRPVGTSIDTISIFSTTSGIVNSPLSVGVTFNVVAANVSFGSGIRVGGAIKH